MTPLATLAIIAVAAVLFVQWRTWAAKRRLWLDVEDERDAAEHAEWVRAMRTDPPTILWYVPAGAVTIELSDTTAEFARMIMGFDPAQPEQMPVYAVTVQATA